MAQQITRRQFVGAAATAAAAGFVPATAQAVNGNGETVEAKWSWEVEPDPITEFAEEYDYEVVVVGAGISGLFAAATAADEGAKVACIEKTGAVRRSLTGIAGFNSQMMKDRGYVWEDERNIALSELMVYNQGFAKAFFIQQWLDNSGELLDWWTDILTEKGVEVGFGTLYDFGSNYTSVAKVGHIPTNYWSVWNIQHIPGPYYTENRYIDRPDWTTPMSEWAAEKGCDFYFNMPGVQLSRGGVGNGKEGRVDGVIAQNENGEYVKFNASKGVFLATGPMDDDRELLACYYPEALDWIQFPSLGNNTGDGHKMGMWIGAKMGTVYCCHSCGALASATGINLHENPESDRFFWTYGPYVATTPVLWVNLDGYRFMSEDIPYFVSASAIDTQPGKRFWSIWDSRWKEKLPASQRPEGSFGEEIRGDDQLEYDIEKGLTLKADTIDELIEKMRAWDDMRDHMDYSRLDPDRLKATIEEYNQMCRDGYDAKFNKAEKYLQTTVEEGPFYACCCTSGWVSTRGGLQLNEEWQVLDTDLKPIPGLYAGGNPAENLTSHAYGNIACCFAGQSSCFSRLSMKALLANN